ncbi:nadph:quinone oxidoreductase : Alcohol dehydrogenase zinc-binding domain protein OS=Pedosphaera parvula (strain Ellin514) GN=Cflav_PD5359 PE=4 SV=1: ADH_N: ADH_zinc_N [Gemmata massiliana]|uniref:Enoyl reductase (ER) domain-containing protein n=1 Tax=Gemmata massiliana TaxID=1210884 RepID=A0A6P2CZY7_9BACT|nr:NAD(P)-dependent alcohol dehydrogenase [Gemmata massiliana]VTR94449.1 nadph:quinone oxidoreductase : Alcohol dehydrogenase zinc-binding domain protein OS=Pedosphaera parvula (strain Ellin514) GN=Cflav_PD5359 PE=4 SV=1: ADH_N: ADH_zinc_N [Gemmata massiliana]
MKALVIQPAFGLENLAVVDRPDPSPGPGQVLVRVRAASLNFRDLLLAKGLYNPKLQFPRILGSDAAGEVIAVGSGVTRFKAGDRIANCFMPDWEDGPISDAAAKSTFGNDRDGVFAELVAVEERALVAIPAHLTFEEAATLPCAAVTAWNALTTAGTSAGTTVLLQGTGGVSIFALQLAHALGARALITSSSDEKLARAAALGATAGVNYRTNADWDKWARQQTGGVGVDVVVEVGGAGTLEHSVKAVKTGGHVALIGVLSGMGAFNPLPILMKAVRLQGVFVGSRAMFEQMNRVIAEKQIRPVIDRVFPFTEAPAAFRYLESGSHFGKIVMSM